MLETLVHHNMNSQSIPYHRKLIIHKLCWIPDWIPDIVLCKLDKDHSMYVFSLRFWKTKPNPLTRYYSRLTEIGSSALLSSWQMSWFSIESIRFARNSNWSISDIWVKYGTWTKSECHFPFPMVWDCCKDLKYIQLHTNLPASPDSLTRKPRLLSKPVCRKSMAKTEWEARSDKRMFRGLCPFHKERTVLQHWSLHLVPSTHQNSNLFRQFLWVSLIPTGNYCETMTQWHKASNTKFPGLMLGTW